MAFVLTNPNPKRQEVGDCTVRAISLATGKSWEEVYLGLCVQGFMLSDMPSSNNVWGQYLVERGFKYNVMPNTCPFCYSVQQFCKDNPKGIYIVGTGTHVICVKDGDYLDAWDSGNKTPLFYFTKEG